MIGKPFEPHIREVTRFTTLRILDENGDCHAVVDVFKYGPRWILFTIQGAGFYLALNDMLKLAREQKATRVSGWISQAHYRLVKNLLRKVTPYTEIKIIEGPMELEDSGEPGVKFVWVDIILYPEEIIDESTSYS